VAFNEALSFSQMTDDTFISVRSQSNDVRQLSPVDM